MYKVSYKNGDKVFEAKDVTEFVPLLQISLHDELLDWIDNTTNVGGGSHLSDCDEDELRNTEGILRDLMELSSLYSKEQLLIFNHVKDIFDITTDENHELGTITMYHLENKEGRHENLNQHQLQRVYINELLKRKEKTSHLLVLNDVLTDNEKRQLFNIEKETINLDKLESEMK